MALDTFDRALIAAVQSGLPLDESMERTAGLLSGTRLSDQVNHCKAAMRSGTPFPQAVEESKLLSPLQAGLLHAGFRTGRTDSAMAEVADRCQTEVEGRLTRLLARFEYGLMILLCGAVGLVLLSVMLPLLGVLSAMGG